MRITSISENISLIITFLTNKAASAYNFVREAFSSLAAWFSNTPDSSNVSLSSHTFDKLQPDLKTLRSIATKLSNRYENGDVEGIGFIHLTKEILLFLANSSDEGVKLFYQKIFESKRSYAQDNGLTDPILGGKKIFENLGPADPSVQATYSISRREFETNSQYLKPPTEQLTEAELFTEDQFNLGF